MDSQNDQAFKFSFTINLSSFYPHFKDMQSVYQERLVGSDILLFLLIF